MEYHVKVMPPAEAEIDEAFAWYHRQSPRSALRWKQGILEAIAGLKTRPERWPLALEEHLLRRNVRQLLYGKRRGVYRVLFAIEGDTVAVLHVRHAAQRPLEP